jgi:translation initiation factor 3 subunit A
LIGDDVQEKSVDDYLVRVATTLRDACRELTPSTTAASDLDSMKRKRIENAEAIRSAVEQEHKRALARKVIIERRKEEAERLLAEQEKEEEERRLAAQRAHEAAEAKRLEVESRQ